MPNSIDPDQTAPIGAVCSGSVLFASIFNSSVVLGNYLQQATSPDDIFRCIFLGATKFVQIMALEPKMGPPRGSHVLHREKDENIFLSEITWPRALIFGM